jgi:hypothetical protein
VTRNAQAFWLRSPGQPGIRWVTLPNPSPDEVVIRTLHSGISRGSEALVFHGGAWASCERSQ